MPDDLLPDPPEQTKGDLAYQAAIAGVSAVPFIGGPAVELVQYWIGPPLTKRQGVWFGEVADAIQTLQRQHVPVDSDQFITAVVHASRIAMGTHLDEKLKMLKAAIINCALPSAPSDIITMRFLRVVEELDPEHFVLLAYLRDPAGHFDRNGIDKPNIMAGGTGSVFDHAQIAIAHLDIVLRDLGERALADVGAWKTIMTSNGAWAPRSSSLGSQLLDFVTYIEPPDEAVAV